MKAARFELHVARDVGDALAALGNDGARPVSGWQSLGPMLNLRLAQPRLLVDLTRIAELRAVEETGEGVVYGAAITHAEIEDGAVPDPTGGALARVAAGIAYRAVRNRGTVGGSLAHADPAADWPVALAALGASVRVTGPNGTRRAAVADFIRGAFAAALGEDEIVSAVEVPRPSKEARWAFYKFCRKEGEFAEAMAAAFEDPARSIRRVVVGATETRPIVLDGEGHASALTDAIEDPVKRRVHEVAVARAVRTMEVLA